MKIIVTGALGHIGSRFIRELPKSFQKAEIVMLDNFLTQRYCSLFNLPVNGRYNFIEADILKADLPAIFSGADAVVHLAAVTNAEASFGNKEFVEEVNFKGTKRVAEACIETGSPLIFPSTTSIYGTQEELVDENCPIEQLKPQSPYAESKFKSEQLLQRLHQKGLRFIICRFGTIFGVSIGIRFHTAVNKFVWQACMSKPITVWRTAMDQKRPYLDLNDAVRAIQFIIKHKLFNGQVYNVVTTNTTVGEIIKIIKKSIPDTSIKYVDCVIMNQLTYNVSNNKFRKEGFRFTGKMPQGIRDTIRLLNGLKKQ